MLSKHKIKLLRLSLAVLGLSSLSLSLPNVSLAQSGQCLVSSGSWANAPLISSQSDNFRVSFDATPSSAAMDAVAGLSNASVDAYTDLAAAVRFNTSGKLDARNGSNFYAATSIPYSARASYHFTLDVYPTAHVYDVYVLTSSGQKALAENLAFRSEQSNTSTLAYLGSLSSQGVLAICNVTVSSLTVGGGSSGGSSSGSSGSSSGGSSGSSSGGSTLSLSSSSLDFGQVGVSTSSYQPVTLTNTGSAKLTIAQISVSGAGFTASGSVAGLILSPNQSTTIGATFAPSSPGTAKGSLTVSSDAANSPSTISLSGKGANVTGHSVMISWNGSSGAAGYNVYVSSRSGGPYTQANYTGTVTSLSFLDTSVQNSQTYYYVVTALNSNHQESGYSAEIQAVVP